MRLLLDTNILPRIGQIAHPHHPIALKALRQLALNGDTYCIGSQTISEFLAVATRPIASRGLGMDQTSADGELSKVTSSLDILYDSAAVLAELRRLVVAYLVAGKTVHDAKLVATMIVNGVKDILTFNIADFTRYREIVVHDPVVVASSTP